MIRFFDWRDVGLVKALAEHGVCLDVETGLTHGNRPLQTALLSYLMPVTGPPTLIWRAEGHPDGAAFGQLRHRPGEPHARLLFVAPQCETAADGWSRVVERLAVEAGERRALNLLADVNEKSCEFEALRHAGFAIYARQSLWKLGAGSSGRAASKIVPLRAAGRSDTLNVSTLYGNIVPRLVQQVEPGPQHIERGFVLEHGGELVAYLDVRRGPAGLWVEPFLHPEAYEQSEAVLQAFLQLFPNRTEKPLYVCVRRYQDWLQDIVARAGFESLGSQAVMVKRLAIRVAEPLLKPLPVVEGQVPTPVARVQARRYDDLPTTLGSDG